MTQDQKPKPARSRFRRYLPGLLFLAVLAGAAFLFWRLFFAGATQPANLITLSGRIEGDPAAVAAKLSGRILEIRVREGDTVNAGDVIAVLDDEQIRARETQAQAAVTDAEARAGAAHAQIAVLQEQLRQSELLTEQARTDAQGRVRQAENEVVVAEAELARQEAANRIAVFDREAYTRLAATGAVPERKGQEAVSTAEQQTAAVAAAKRRVESARGGLLIARATLTNPGIRASQAGANRKQIAQQQKEVASANAKIEQARAQLSEAQANRKDLEITAPFNGTVATRTAEPGEVVSAGTAIITLLDLSKVYLRGFVPEGEIGKVKLGQPARVYLDSNPNQPLEATVSRIDPEATFTPENTYFRDERVKQVVGIKLQLKSGAGFAKPGMPADGEILVEGNTWPSSTRHK
ncbi:MAG TPA: HlyD family efflux transporter periplasmic adaptor subunit [Pyrinomonadaceae bacterium]|jgi:HlyD family secretion protein|nr:HlyD family efflux transporter periplasmic adaptor subunit [Pyrinomonadaceae bacterium]